MTHDMYGNQTNDLVEFNKHQAKKIRADEARKAYYIKLCLCVVFIAATAVVTSNYLTQYYLNLLELSEVK